MMNILDNFRSYLNQNRTVYRAGWLRYIPFNEMIPSDEHRFWVVFAIHNQTSPFLEFYRRRQNVGRLFNEGPVSKHSLEDCLSILPVNHHCEHNSVDTYELNVRLKSQTIRLAADSRNSMMDWIYSIQNKLYLLNILPNNQCPDSEHKSPEYSLRNSPICETNSQNILSSSLENSQDNNSNAFYERIFSKDLRNNNNNDDDDEDKYDDDDEAPPPYELPEQSASSSNQDSECLSFRELQVKSLSEQISNSEGIILKVRRKDLLKGVAFVDIDDKGIFICGWRQRQYPNLHDIFHIGDRILSINGHTFQQTENMRSYLKEMPVPKVDILIQRLPYGKIFCLKRQFAQQDLGVVRQNGTAKILEVKKNSIASASGLCSCSLSIFDCDPNSWQTDGNWHLTEINNRPLNLFFKDDEIETRLGAIGKEISILVQPSALVCKLKKQMKANVRNYKEYLVQ